MIRASNWRRLARHTLQGFVTLTLAPSGLVLHECALHEKNGKRWIGLPSTPQIDSEGRHRLVDGKKQYTAVVEIIGKEERDRFQAAALQAVERLLGTDATP
jgi:hypothetical protein